jgi:hypothetical protein
MGITFLSPGVKVKRTAIAPANFSLSLTHDLPSLASLPFFENGVQTDLPSPVA